jgi:DNA-binding transcriptional MerR regulator
MPSARSYSLSELVETTGFDRRTIVYYIQSGLLPKVGRRGPHTRYPEECLTRLLFIKGVRKLQTQGRLLTATLAEIRRALAARDGAGIRELLDRDLPVDEVTALFAEPADSGMEAPAAAPPQQVLATPAPGPGPARGPAGERRSYGLADAGIRKRFGNEKPAAPAPPEGRHEGTHPGQPTRTPATFQPPGQTLPPILPPAAAVTETATGIDPELGDLLRELEVRPTLNPRRGPPGSPEQWTEIPITSRIYLSVRGLPADDAPLAEAVARLLKRALRARLPSASL